MSTGSLAAFSSLGLLFFVVMLLVAAFFLWVGAKVAGIQNAGFLKATLAAFLGMVAGAILSMVPAIGWLLAILAYIVIIKYVFNTDWGKAIIAWLVSFVASLIVGFILAMALGLSILSIAKARAAASLLYLLT